ncbi:hypothetical protein [Endozoicomonas numazuensis]|uniref:Uncharacterized protein n=1 Tax=Endozoicomonas numazuensis TaxID=1137799 RepID=A0A081NM14_9GAMM|nr:hypothetical protein [Endozoicomonas numazuensis]KEQ19487.1 hypothetical protein GZ78_06030 [Endozoicomonas numazuensis]
MAFKIEKTRIYQKLLTIGQSSPLVWFQGRKLVKLRSTVTRRQTFSQRLKRSSVIRKLGRKLQWVKPRLFKALGLVARKRKAIDRRSRQHLKDTLVAAIRQKTDEFIQAVFKLRECTGKGSELNGKSNSLEDFVSEVGRHWQDASKTPQFIAYLQQQLRDPASKINRLEASLKECFELMMAQRDINPNQMMTLTSARALLSELAYQTFSDRSAFDHWCQASRESDKEMMLEINKALASLY